jgi:hypothetical protein
MRAQEPVESIFAAGTAVFKIRLGAGASERDMSVTVTRDDRLEWTYEQPAWRSLALGCGMGAAYLWSARAVIVLSGEGGADPDILDVDEDLLFVFKAEAGWLLVCETSIRLIVGREETCRIEIGDVIERARWNERHLLVEDASGATTTIHISDERLTC